MIVFKSYSVSETYLHEQSFRVKDLCYYHFFRDVYFDVFYFFYVLIS